MSIFATASFTIGGGWDVFDKVKGIGSKIREAITEADDEDYPFEIHQGGGLFQVAPHFAGGKQPLLDRLTVCEQMLDDVCLEYQTIMAEMPD